MKLDSINWGRLAVYMLLLLFAVIWWVGFFSCLKWLLD